MLYATMRIGNNCEYFLFQSITEISRSYNKVTYGLLENDKLFYNPNDLPQIVIERYPDSILGIKLLFSVVCYKGDKYPPEQTIESR